MLKRLISYAVFFGLSLSVAVASYYPLGCYYVGGDEVLPVTNVSGESAAVVVNGKKEKVMVSDLAFSRVPFYREVDFHLIDVEAYGWSSNVRATGSWEVGAYIPNRFLIDIEFVADRDLENCYALIVSGTREGLELQDPDGLIMTFDSIGRVKAGRTIKKTLTGYFPNDPEKKRDEDFFIAFFDNGVPISTSFDDRVYGHFMTRKLRSHEAKVEAHLETNRGRDAKHKASSTFTPYLPEALYEECGPIDTKVVFQISEEGRVRVESFSNLENPQAEAFLRMLIADWLFLPKVENGKAVPTRTATMIQY